MTAVVPPLLVPRSWPGGQAVLGRWRRRALADVDALWINDPVAGVAVLRPGVAGRLRRHRRLARACRRPERERRRIVAAEDVLARRARTVVCSAALAAAMARALRRERDGRPQRRRHRRDPHRGPAPPRRSRPARGVRRHRCTPTASTSVCCASWCRAGRGRCTSSAPTSWATRRRPTCAPPGRGSPGRCPGRRCASWLRRRRRAGLPAPRRRVHPQPRRDQGARVPRHRPPGGGHRELRLPGPRAPGLRVASRPEFVAAALAARGRFPRAAAVDWAERADAFAHELLCAAEPADAG